MLLNSRLLALSSMLAIVASLAYFIQAYAGFGVVNGRWTSAGWSAVIVNVALFTAFAVHLALWARPRTRSWFTRHVPATAGRALFIWSSAIVFVVMLWAWVPVPGLAWRVSGTTFVVLEVFCLTGLVIIGLALSAIDGLEFLGLRQGLALAPRDAELKTTGVYGVVRHPLYLGWILLVWCLPVMTGTRLVFAATTTAYILAALPNEERGLARHFGAAYERYQRLVRWRLLPFIY